MIYASTAVRRSQTKQSSHDVVMRPQCRATTSVFLGVAADTTWMAGSQALVPAERNPLLPYPSRASSTALMEMRDQAAVRSRNAM